MKSLMNNHVRFFHLAFPVAMTGILLLTGSCHDNDPQKEDVPELITKATLTFSPSGGGTAVVVSATDPDGEGVQDIKVDGDINLDKDRTYILTLTLINGLAQPGEEAYDVTREVEEEGDEHQFFFSWTNNTFSNPAGNGNIDTSSDPLNYSGGANSKDVNGRPLGLTTTWTTASTPTTGASFRVMLKHQPDLKSDTSNATQGETDLDITFTLNIR